MKTLSLALSVPLLSLGLSAQAQPPQGDQDTSMGFFITSTPLDGGNLGGLDGADQHCSALAEAAGVQGKTWRAYLSTDSVDARDRIGQGPWYNAKDSLVAANLDDLHYSNVNFTRESALNEKGELVNGRSDSPNQHDILTGTTFDGSSSGQHCSNWTSSSDEHRATAGHFDRVGGGPVGGSWNAAHETRGCSMESLRATGGNGYFYCFAE